MILNHVLGKELKLLKMFDLVLAECNLTRAATWRGLAQPALSRSLAGLCSEFDGPLSCGAGWRLVDSKGLGLRASHPLVTTRSTLDLKLGHLIVSTRGDLGGAVDGVAQVLEAPLPHISA